MPDGLMSHQALQNFQRYTGIQHVHRIGMAERMWCDRNRERHTVSSSSGNRLHNPGPDRSVRHFPDPRFLCPSCATVTPLHGYFQQKTGENPRPVRAGRKGGKALRALKK